MTTLMPVYESLPEFAASGPSQALVKAMSDAAREVMREFDVQPKGDDRAAIFDEACAVFLKDCAS